MGEMHGAGRSTVAGVLLLVALAAHARVLPAQLVQGTVRDSASQLPLPGTIVMILDPSGKAAARGKTDQGGRFRLAARAGKFAGRMRLRVLRMGFRPTEHPIPAAPTSGIDVTLVSFPIVLEEYQVVYSPKCVRRPDRVAALALLQQVRTALFATVLARSQNSATMKRLLYQRRYDSESGRILTQSVRVRVTNTMGEPFSAARSAAAFDRQGFRDDAEFAHAYVGPDAETLIDDAFAERYCFSVIAPDRARPQQVGLGFEPAERDSGRVDIAGTVWVDTVARVLHDLTFRYVGLDRPTSALAPEGRLSFKELANGVVIVDTWSISLGGERGDGGGGRSRMGRVVGEGAPKTRAQEIGGEIARASWNDGYSWSAPLGTVRLHAVDGQGRPAAATSVQIADTDYPVTTDSTGNFPLSDLLPGPYTATIRDPRLAALDIPLTTSVRFYAVRDSVVDVRAQVETADDFVRKRCEQDVRGAGEIRLLGRVVGADGQPVKEARWTIRDESGVAILEGGRVDDAGFFHFCQLSLNKRISLDVTRDDRRTSQGRVVTDRLTLVRFVLPP